MGPPGTKRYQPKTTTARRPKPRARKAIPKLDSILAEIAGTLDYAIVAGDPVATLKNISDGRLAVRHKIVETTRPRKSALLTDIQLLQEQLDVISKAEKEAIQMADDKAAECSREQEKLFIETMENFAKALASARDIDNCTVCQRPNDGPLCVTDTTTLQCGHVFHAECFGRMPQKFRFADDHGTVLSKFVCCPNCKQEHCIPTTAPVPSLMCNETLPSATTNSLTEIWDELPEHGSREFWGPPWSGTTAVTH